MNYHIRLICSLLVFMTSINLTVKAQERGISSENLKKHVYVLASDSLAGRKYNTEGGWKAARYIKNQLTVNNLTAKCDTVLSPKGENMINIHCAIEGNDPVLKNEWIVVVCHYDHFGVSNKGKVYPGANDNATSVAALLEMARNLEGAKRSVMFLWSDAEEFGILGTRAFVANPPLELSNVKLAIASEMLGHANKVGRVQCIGSSFIEGGLEIVRSVEIEGLTAEVLDYETLHHHVYPNSTDSQPFLKKGIPVMVWHTPSMENLHTINDTADSIDYDGLYLSTRHIFESLKALANSEILSPSENMAKMKR